jgi:hypothetical protein
MLITYTGLYNSNYTVLIGMMTGEEWTEAGVEVATANFETLSPHLPQQTKINE